MIIIIIIKTNIIERACLNNHASVKNFHRKIIYVTDSNFIIFERV